MKRTHLSPDVSSAAIAACALQVRSDARLQRLFPAGVFDAPRGALAGHGPWRIDAQIAQKVIARAATRSTRIPVDYEHQTLLAEQNGLPAPAAGWIEPGSLTWVAEGDAPGLYGDIEWTARAAEYIKNGEYAYLSPVFPYASGTGEVLDLLHVGLTNTPGIDAPIHAALSALRARFFASPATGGHKEIDAMDLKALLLAAGLPETATEAEALTALAALKAKADGADAAQTQLAALKAAAPDPAKYVPVDVMVAVQNEIAALKAQALNKELTEVIDGALADGRLLPDQKSWAESLGKSDLAALKGFVATLKPVTALQGMQSQGAASAGKSSAALDATELAVCKALGLTADEYTKSRQLQEGK